MTGSHPEVPLSEEAERLYLSYALSVITARALPDVRDGLKPVQRRILYGMHNSLRLGPDAKPKKCARIVGDVMGQLHPHGDSAIYEALVRMAQDWVLRAPLVYGFGNFGSLDGDAPAAMRYTEARLQKLAMELLVELGKKTVSFRPNYDGTRFEPTVLPARFPNLLVNGAQGIAVGMATSIPPHNLGEVVDACLALIEDPKLETRQLLKHVKGPDFPTGGELLATSAELTEVYEKGHGSLPVRAEWKVDTRSNDDTILITSVPYGPEKRVLVEKIAEVIVQKKLPALVDVRDESTDDVRIVLELKRDANPELVMAYLYKHTPLQTNIQVNLTCLVPGAGEDAAPQPQRLSLVEMIRHFLDFRFEVVTRRLEHELDELRRRLHILDGFLTVFDALDEIIRLIRKSEGKADAAQQIMARFGLDEEQTDAILELRLYRLARLEILILQQEADEKRKAAAKIEALLASPKKRWGLVRDELAAIKDEYANPRRTRLVRSQLNEPEFSAEDFIVDGEGLVIATVQGWVKRQQSVKDLTSTRIREGDAVLACQAGELKAPIAFFSSKGVCYVARIADIPQTTGYGDPIQKLFKLADGEKLAGALSFDPRFLDVPEPDPDAAEPEGPYALAVTRLGLALRFSLRAHREPSTRAGRKFARVRPDDEVIAVLPCDEFPYVMAAATDGHAIAVDVSEIPILGGPGKGSMLIKLGKGVSLIGAIGARSVRSDKLVMHTESGTRYERGVEALLTSRGGRGKAIVKRQGFESMEIPLPDIPDLTGGL
jgi:DNA gyrase subunit A